MIGTDVIDRPNLATIHYMVKGSPEWPCFLNGFNVEGESEHVVIRSGQAVATEPNTVQFVEAVTTDMEDKGPFIVDYHCEILYIDNFKNTSANSQYHQFKTTN